MLHGPLNQRPEQALRLILSMDPSQRTTNTEACRDHIGLREDSTGLDLRKFQQRSGRICTACGEA